NLLPVVGGQQVLFGPRFRDRLKGDHHAIIVTEGPQAVVEQPMGVLSEGKSVARVVVAGIGELVDVRAIDDAAAGDGGEPVSRERACVVVGGDYAQSKSRLSTLLLRVLWTLVGRITLDLVIGRNGHPGQLIKPKALVRLEILRDQ